MIIDSADTPQIIALKKELGTDRTRASFVRRCTNSCMSSDTSVMHAKFFLFSTTGASKLVSMVSSANIYTGNTAGSWNNIHTIVGDATIYDSLKLYFNDMLPDRDWPDYYRTTTSGKHKLYFFPRAAESGVVTDDILSVLNNVTCTGVAAGYGSNGRTVVRVEQWGWSSARIGIANRLWQLHNQGCNVQVTYNGFQTSSEVTAALLKRSTTYGVMRVYNAGIDTNGNGVRDIYMHHKVVAISGVWFGRNNTKVVYTGSANFTKPGLRANNEIIMRVKDNATFDKYNSNFNYIRDNWTRRVTTVPLTASTSSIDAESETNLDRIS